MALEPTLCIHIPLFRNDLRGAFPIPNSIFKCSLLFKDSPVSTLARRVNFYHFSVKMMSTILANISATPAALLTLTFSYYLLVFNSTTEVLLVLALCYYLLVLVHDNLPWNYQLPFRIPFIHRRKGKVPVSVNYHFTRRCNKACGFCFHTAT